MRFLLCFLVLISIADCGKHSSAQDQDLGFASDWKQSALSGSAQWFELRGTGDRNNPIRRALAAPFDGPELYVRFRIRYDASSVDDPGSGNGEFFVCWLDERDGGDSAGHSSAVPNFGIHVDEDRNAWMARFDSSHQSFSTKPFVGGQEFALVARLSKSEPGEDSAYNQLDVWVEPAITDRPSPDITATSSKSIRAVQWIGFATGRKTEATDRIAVSDVELHNSWIGVFGLPKLVTDTEKKKAPVEITSHDLETSTRTVSFTQQVLPVLREHCFECHKGELPTSGIRLDSYDELLNQVTPRDAKNSHLMELLRAHDSAERMPPDEEGRRALNDEELQLIITWLDEGVAWDFDELPTLTPQSNHWSFQPLRTVQIPQDVDPELVRTPVDAFVLRRQQELGVTSVGRADWKTLQRRIALDLTGLPVSEFEELTNANSDDAIDRVIDRLLKTDAYGERWGRHWLDVARWAESNGYQHNRFRPQAWKYRDYVIQAFKQDLPFDLFIREQLAGDEMAAQLVANESESPAAIANAITATGFLAAARYSGNELDKEIQRNDILVDVTNATAKAFMGVTLECAQCHSHKFDPFSIRDYYRLQAFFADGQPASVVVQPRSQILQQLVDTRWSLFNTVKARLVESKRKAGASEPILVIPKSVVSGMTAQERKAFSQLEAAIAQFPKTWGWVGASTEFPVAPHEMRWPLPWNPEALGKTPSYLRLRGDVKAVGPEVQPGWPALFGRTPVGKRRRLDLADWIASPEHPLTARVWVNRIWQWHFGRGLVESSGDFGTQGSPPSHPDLLDWLSRELIQSGWSTRHIHRLIMRSNTYRLSATTSDANVQRDPGNLTWWHWETRRIEGESLRDCILATAGMLDRSVGGPSVVENATASQRRSIYLRHERQRIPESLTLFDSPPALTACSRRRTSTVSLQPLFLLNSPLMQDVCEKFADRVRKSTEDVSDHGAKAFELALGRKPDADEEEKLRDFLAASNLELLCQSLLNLNEFVYVP